MENLKIHVNSEAESKDIQINLEQLGFKKSVWGIFVHNSYFIFANCNYYSRDDIENFSECDYKEITLPELRDLVVLKRNDAGDANYIRPRDGKEYFKSSQNNFYHMLDSEWIMSTWENGQLEPQLKPIEKKEMKEYLRKNSKGTYSYIGTVRPEHVSDFMIEIPEGRNIAVIEDSKVKFYSKYTSADLDHLGKDLIWMRPSHPEALPFIDDEPKITTAKGSELDYIAKIHDMRDRYDGESDEDYRYQLEHYISRKEPSLNDQYAEIEKVRQTLNQRQEQYGSFEDVAMITEQMVDVMRKGYYENLAYNQKMALYMICSKIARIVNGNPNHKDSWHDIAGYATLIDNELVSKKDMPF